MSTRWVSAKGHFGQAGIDAGAGGIDQALHRGPFGHLQEIEEPFQIGFLIGKGVDQGVAHPGLGGQVADLLGPVVLKEGLQGREIGQVGGDGDKIGVLAQFQVPVMFESRRVIIVEVVQPHYPGALGQQGLRHMKADEPGAAGHQKRIIFDLRGPFNHSKSLTFSGTSDNLL